MGANSNFLNDIHCDFPTLLDFYDWPSLSSYTGNIEFRSVKLLLIAAISSGIDESPGMLSQAQLRLNGVDQSLQKVKFEKMDATKLAFDDDKAGIFQGPSQSINNRLTSSTTQWSTLFLFV